MRYPLVSRLFKKLAKRAGVKVNLEPEWGFAGQIVTPSGTKHYFRNTNLDLNTRGAMEIARDKDYAKYFMQKMGYPVIPGKTFFTKEFCEILKSKRDIHAAYSYAKKLGFPVVVKPNSKSQGLGVSKVWNKKEFYRAARFAMNEDRVILVEKAITGRDYRVLVLGNKLIVAYERIPVAIIGDGRHKIKELIITLRERMILQGRKIHFSLKDFRIAARLKRMGFTMNYILPRGEELILLDNSNLSTGGTAKEVTHSIHPQFKKIALKLVKDMGLQYAGVDLMIEGNIEKKPKRFWIIEINSAPGLGHYAAKGKKEAHKRENLYLKILLALKKI